MTERIRVSRFICIIIGLALGATAYSQAQRKQATPAKKQEQTPADRDLKLETVAKPEIIQPGRALDGKGNAWAVVIGVSQYKFIPPRSQLKYAHRDAEDFADFLRSPNGGGVRADHILVLLNERATVAAIRTALSVYLPRAAEGSDVVYIYFAGHGVVDIDKTGYLLANDSDPQNLYATALPFDEVDKILTDRLHSRLVVLIADACHSGSIGWVERRAEGPLLIPQYLEQAGKRRAVLRLLASRPDERSFEDERWGGGHGVFTYHLLEGLRGKAERERDGIVRQTELAEYVARIVPEQTGARQHPRIAGDADAGLPLAVLRAAFGPLPPSPPESPLIGQIERKLTEGQVIEPGGAFEVYERLVREVPLAPQRLRIETALNENLENIGQLAIGDYVQSSAPFLRRQMLSRAGEAYARLRVLRPGDQEVEAKQLFCQARLSILLDQPAQAIQFLQRSLALDSKTACPYNAMGVALEKLGRNDQAFEFFRRAAERAPEWALPRIQLATQYQNRMQPDAAIEQLRLAISFQPRLVQPRWMLTRLFRTIGRLREAEREGLELTRVEPNYAPTYVELGNVYESMKEYAKAAECFNTYAVLAPNFADTADMRARAARNKAVAERKPPSLLKK